MATLSSNGEGKGVLSVMIGNEVYVKTWNNAFSDVTEGTLIPPQSRLYAKALALRVGQVVVISGTFFRNPTDCIHEASVTMDGSMTKPEFIFQFHEIASIE